MSACLRLESFSTGRIPAPAPAEPAITRAELEAARAAGFEAGRAAARASDRAALAEAVDRLAAALAGDAVRREAEAAEWRDRTARLVRAVIAQLASRQRQAVLAERIVEEIEALRSSVPAPSLRLLCDAEAAALVRVALQGVGLAALDIELTDGPAAIQVQQGVLAFDMDRFTKGLERLMDEFEEETDDGQD